MNAQKNKCVIKGWMISAAFAFVMLVSWADNAMADDCPEFTYEQEWLLHAAYESGRPHDLGYTLAAIVWQESFLDDEVRLTNLSDGEYGSYGPAHVQATTAADMDGLEQTQENWEAMARVLMSDPIVGIHYGLRYLLKHSDRSYIGTIEKYNGTGEAAMVYGQRVYQKVLTLMECRPWD